MALPVLVTVAYFSALFPELAAAGSALIQAKLDDASVTHTGPTWSPGDGARTDLAILYKAACLVALSPGAKCLRLDPKNPDSIYDKRWRELARAHYGGPRVL